MFLLISRGKVLSCSVFFFVGEVYAGKKYMPQHAKTLARTVCCKILPDNVKKDTPFYADIYFNVTKLRKKTSFVYGYFENVTSIVMSCCKICVYTHPGNSNYNLTASPIACTDMTRLSRDIFCHIN